jgi:hypothetical protein
MPATVLPDLDVEKLRRFCKRRVPKRVKDKVRLEVTVKGKRVSIKRRPPFLGVGEWTSSPIAQVRYEGNGTWTLYFGDRYGKWMLYFDLDPQQPTIDSAEGRSSLGAADCNRALERLGNHGSNPWSADPTLGATAQRWRSQQVPPYRKNREMFVDGTPMIPSSCATPTIAIERTCGSNSRREYVAPPWESPFRNSAIRSGLS